MKTSVVILLITVLLAFLAANYYVVHRIWKLIPAEYPTARIAVAVCGAVLVASFFVGLLGRSGNIPDGIVAVCYWLGTAWIFIMLYLLIVFLVADLLRLMHILPPEIMYGNWTSLVVLVGAMVLIFTAGNIAYHKKRRVQLDIPANVEKPVRIVAVSDLHLGYGIGAAELGRWVDMINAEKPDAVVIAGDAIDTNIRPLSKGDFARELRRLDAPLGVYLAPGNHEYISGIDASIGFLENAGVRVLRDSTALVGGIYVIGRDDKENRRRKTIAELTEGLDGAIPTLLLDHQPYNLAEAAAAGIDLQISGHTHRGQVWPATWITDSIFERSHGHLQKGDTQYYISSGLGLWGGKFRIGSRSEYIVVDFVPRME